MISFTALGYKQPLIHIGYPKALSSWLQSNLFVSELGYWPAMGPLAVQRKIVDPAPFCYRSGLVADSLSGVLPDNHELVPVITSETLSGNMRHGGYNAHELAGRLESTFPEARILCVVREQKQLIRSLYSEVVKWGMPHSIKHFLQPNRYQIAPQFRVEHLQFHNLVEHYQQRFGGENLLVLPYELFLHSPQEFLHRLAGFSGLSDQYKGAIESIDREAKVNKAFSLSNIQIQRWINYWLVSNPYNYSGLIREKEGDVWARDLAMISRQRWLPGFLDHYLEDIFRATVDEQVSGKFKFSNQRLQELTGVDLTPYGYEL